MDISSKATVADLFLQIVFKMVRSYKRKSTRQTWNEESMKAAIKAVTDNGLGLKKASAEFSVPKTTLRRRVKGLNKSAIGATKSMGNFKVGLF